MQEPSIENEYRKYPAEPANNNIFLIQDSIWRVPTGMVGYPHGSETSGT